MIKQSKSIHLFDKACCFALNTLQGDEIHPPRAFARVLDVTLSYLMTFPQDIALAKQKKGIQPQPRGYRKIPFQIYFACFALNMHVQEFSILSLCVWYLESQR